MSRRIFSMKYVDVATHGAFSPIRHEVPHVQYGHYAKPRLVLAVKSKHTPLW